MALVRVAERARDDMSRRRVARRRVRCTQCCRLVAQRALESIRKLRDAIDHISVRDFGAAAIKARKLARSRVDEHEHARGGEREEDDDGRRRCDRHEVRGERRLRPLAVRRQVPFTNRDELVNASAQTLRHRPRQAHAERLAVPPTHDRLTRVSAEAPKLEQARLVTAEAVELGRREAASLITDQDELFVFIRGRYTEISHRSRHAVDAADVNMVWYVE